MRRFSATFSAMGRLEPRMAFFASLDLRFDGLDLSLEGAFQVFGVIVEIFAFDIEPLGVLLFGFVEQVFPPLGLAALEVGCQAGVPFTGSFCAGTRNSRSTVSG